MQKGCAHTSTPFLHSYTFPILLFHSEESLRQVIDEIAGDEAFLAQVLDGEVAGKTMEVHTDAGSICLLVAASQKSGDDTCKHIAAARRSHTAVARRAELHLTIRMTEGREMALQQDVAVQTVGKLACLVEALGAVAAGDASQTVKLSRMWSEDEVLR